tara:strand:+ start:387 stop:1250 length:864 start_codon:yes stop_codon:yes gene_type:complete
MFFINDITVIIPSTIHKISKKWIYQINNYVENNLSVIISVPPNMNIKEIYKKGFSKNILIINSYKKGQVAQRQFAYKFSKRKLILHMDDDIYFDLESIKGLLDIFSNLPENSCLGPALKIKSKSKKYKYNFFIFIRNLLIFSKFNPKPGTISVSSFPVPHDNEINTNNRQEVEWLPGGLYLIRQKHCIKDNYFKFNGKAYCEDLFLSSLLKRNKIKLYLDKTFSYKTKLESYRLLSLNKFIKFLREDFKIRNCYRKSNENPLSPFLLAYFYLILAFLITKFKKYLRL